LPTVATPATPDTISLPPGQYSVAESLPLSTRGTWHLTGVACNGQSLPAPGPVSVTISAGTGAVCNFENTFVPEGSITVRKVTFGGTGTAGFAIFPQTTPPSDVVFQKVAKVTQQGVPVVATGDATDALPLGTYKIQEFAAEGTDPKGWALTSVICDGQLFAASQGSVLIKLTAGNPDVVCTFTNTFTPGQGPTPPTPEPPPNPDPTPVADIEIDKKPDRVTAVVGDTVTYTITVTNKSDLVAAQNVIVAEQAPIANAKILSLTPSQGTCQFVHYPASCSLGTIEARKTATITAKLQATHVGPMPNNVAVNSSNNVLRPPTDQSPGKVRPRPKPKKPAFTG